MYTVICDNCGADHNEGAEYSAWSDQEYAKDCSLDDDWIEVDDKNYCPECVSYDDEDNLILKTIQLKNK